MKTIGIIGMGKLGLCLALNLERAGYHIVGVDSAADRIQSIREKSLKTTEPQVEDLLAAAKNLAVDASYEALNSSNVELVFVIVPTPSLPSGAFDHSIIEDVLDNLETLGRPSVRKTLVINSTTMPGFCKSISERLDRMNYTLVYNPEFIAQGSIIRDQRQPDQVLIGVQHASDAEPVQGIYEVLCENKPSYQVMDWTSAEISKLATNCFLTMKISFANHLGDLAEKSGADTDKILACIGADSRIGSKYLGYGFGYGGPCFPRDNKALMHFGQANNHELHLSAATERINEEHLQHQLEVLRAEKREIYRFEDVAYKPGTEIIEESQQLKLAAALAKGGARVEVKASPTLQQTLNERFGNLFHFVK